MAKWFRGAQIVEKPDTVTQEKPANSAGGVHVREAS